MSEQDTSRDLVAQERGPMHTGVPAYRQFDPEMISLIGKAIMPDRYQTHELYYILELAATYGLDPFAKEIMAVRWTRNADSAVQAVVGRDGLLAIAQRHPDYLGFRCAAVYEKDEFEVLEAPVEWKLPSGRPVYTKFKHSVKSFGRGARGALLGAFAEVYREGKAPTDFMAYLEDYDASGKSEKSPWVKMKDVMIEKVALVSALRLAFRISGLYIREELSGVMLDAAGRRVEPDAAEDWGDDPEVEARLRRGFEAQPDRYLPAKRSVMLRGLDADGRLELAARLEREAEQAGVELPPLEVAESEVVDAEPVAEEESEPEPEPEPEEEEPEGPKADPAEVAEAERIAGESFGGPEQASLLN